MYRQRSEERLLIQHSARIASSCASQTPLWSSGIVICASPRIFLLSTSASAASFKSARLAQLKRPELLEMMYESGDARTMQYHDTDAALSSAMFCSTLVNGSMQILSELDGLET